MECDADKLGIRIALVITGVVLAAGLTTKLKFPLQAGQGEVDVSPSIHWPDPALAIEPELEHGPVLVQIEYMIDPAHQYEFALAAKDFGFYSQARWSIFLGNFQT